jgi:heme-degrading monooxygenase HmoA
VEVTRYEDEHAARETTRQPEFTAWHSRLLETLELGPSFSHFHSIVQSQPAPMIRGAGAQPLEEGL